MPSGSVVETLLLIATWVCRFGSPARESRCVNAAAIKPFASTWATPPLPSLVKQACSSRYSSAAPIAASWAASICSATSRGATAHSADTLLTGVKVRSNPATALVFCRPDFATHPDSSRSSAGARPYSRANISVATRVRMVARSSASMGAFHFSPPARLCSTNAFAQAMR